MKLECVIVCVHYLDYLSLTYALNRRVFDHVIVVTSKRDPQTIAFCQQQGITCAVTEVMYRHGASFDRGLAINEGFKCLKYHDWVIHMDADIAVPDNFRESLPPLHPDLFYGARRVIVKSLQEFRNLVAGKLSVYDLEFPDGSGCGYFQMFNWQSGVIKRSKEGYWYPSAYNCCESDWKFRNAWGEMRPENKTTHCFVQLDFPVIHFGAHGQNHNGRVSPPIFQP